MQKMILLMLYCMLPLMAGSPIAGYERVIDVDKNVSYHHKNSDFSFKAKRLIDTDNIYNKGVVDNYDDPYIQTILQNQHPFQTIGGKKETIHIIFNNKKNRDNFLKEFTLSIFKKEDLTIKLYMREDLKLYFPFNLKVYPLFIIKDRYVQGVMSKKLLKSLMTQSHYLVKSKIMTLKDLKNRLKKKFGLDDLDAEIHYNEKTELFEVHRKDTKKVDSYISKEGRYILVLD